MEAGQFPNWLKPLHPLPRSSKRDAKIAWLRNFVKASANDLALDELYGIDRDAEYPMPGSIGGLAEVLMICINTAVALDEDRSLGESAARAEWAAAQARAVDYSEDLRRNIWTLGRDRAPGAQIMARAKQVNLRQFERNSAELQVEDLTEITKKIVVAAATGRRPHGR